MGGEGQYSVQDRERCVVPDFAPDRVLMLPPADGFEVCIHEEIRSGATRGPGNHTPRHYRPVTSAIRIVFRTIPRDEVVPVGTFAEDRIFLYGLDGHDSLQEQAALGTVEVAAVARKRCGLYDVLHRLGREVGAEYYFEVAVVRFHDEVLLL